MKEEYLSIAEFAKRAGISHQAIYKRLDGDLQPWLQVAKGRKMLNIKALELFKQEKNATVSTEIETIKLLQKTVEMLENELSLKNEEIKELHSRLKETNQIAYNAQKLHAVNLLEDSTDETEQDIEAAPAKKLKWQFWKKH